jgi:hypothetical protein
VKVIYIHREGLMMLAARLDEFGRAGWIAATVLAFIVWWPLGLASLAFIAATRRLGACGGGRWYATAGQGRPGPAGGPWNRGGSCGWGWHGGRTARPSGNAAFDEYRAETLRRLEEEQREFVDYLERLRRAKDKAEFDQFMSERRRGPATPDSPETV